MLKKLYFLSILWYNKSSGDLKIKSKKENKNMFNEELFNFNIENIQNDLAIEGMEITQNDIEMFKMFANEQIQMPELIQMIKNEPINY